MSITKKTNINEIVEESPEAVGTLFEAGMMCVGCPMSEGESLEQGCKAHGMNDKEVKELVDKLNKVRGGK
jgi:hybrid cluster-associated redox disulfide protein